MEKSISIDSGNSSGNDGGNFTVEEKEFAENLSRSMEKQADDFGYGQKEREENELALLRKKMKDMVENTPEEEKKRLRAELLKEEAEKLEKKEDEQIAISAMYFNSYDKEAYVPLRKAGIVKNPEQFTELFNEKFNPSWQSIATAMKFLKTRGEFLDFLEKGHPEMTGKGILINSQADIFERLIDFYKIDSPQKFEKFFNNSENNLKILESGKKENVDFFTSILSIEQFQAFLKEKNSTDIVSSGNIEAIKNYLDFKKINDPEQVLATLRDQEFERIMFCRAEPENLKYIYSNFIKNEADIDTVFSPDGKIGDLMRNASLKNVQYVVDLYQIKTADELEDLYGSIGAGNVLSKVKLENLICFTKFCQEKKEFIDLCREIRNENILVVAKPENFREITALCQDKEQFKKFREVNNISGILAYFGPGNLKSIISHCRIEEMGEQDKLIKEMNDIRTNNCLNKLSVAKKENLDDVFNFFQIRSLDDFRVFYTQEGFENILRSKPENFHYLIENNILTKNNFFRFNLDSVNCLDALVGVTENKKEDIDFLRKLVNQYPNSAENTLCVLADYDNNIDTDFARDAKDIFEILDKVGNITPIIFNKFRKLGTEERNKFAEDIKTAKKEMFKNKPIDMKNSRDEIAELIYLSYKPIGMTYQQTKDFLAQLEDRTEDLKDYKFPESGYDILISNPIEKVLKKEKELDFEKINNVDKIIKSSVPDNLAEEKEENSGKDIFLILNKIAKAAPSLKDQEASLLLSIIKSENISNFAKRHENIPRSNITEVYGYLSEAKEILGIIFKDNFKQSLEGFLKKNPESTEKTKEILIKGKQPFLRALGKDFKDSVVAKDEYWSQLNIEKMSELLSIFTDQKIIGNLRKDVSKELNKIGDKGAEDQKTSRKQKENIKLKAYISKNVGSFFAKASAGICTAEDISLFNRSDHFHINTAEDQGNGNELLRGNTQAYIIEDGGEKSLLLRGINPNSDFMYEINVGSYCDKIIETAKKFKEENGLNEVYLSEQLDFWHALTNRDSVYNYLKDNYLKEENVRDFKFNITTGKQISKIYKV